MSSILKIQGLKLKVNLGWRDKERQQEQVVLLDLEIAFRTPPMACTTDNLTDTICYFTLINTLRDKLAVRHFHLIEHLGHEIYQLVKHVFPMGAHIAVHVTKHPPIEGLSGVSFSYSDNTRE